MSPDLHCGPWANLISRKLNILIFMNVQILKSTVSHLMNILQPLNENCKIINIVFFIVVMLVTLGIRSTVT
jgi:hypothetical protein